MKANCLFDLYAMYKISAPEKTNANFILVSTKEMRL